MMQRLSKDPAEGGNTQGQDRLGQGANHHQAARHTGSAHMERQKRNVGICYYEAAGAEMSQPEGLRDHAGSDDCQLGKCHP